MITIESIIEIKRPVDLAKVRMSDGSKRFVSKSMLNHKLVAAYKEMIRGEGRDGQA